MDSEAKKQWQKENSCHLSIRLMNKGDADIISALEGKQKATEVKRLLRLGIEADKEKGAD